MATKTSTVSERISILEVSVENVRSELGEIDRSLKLISDRLSKTRETNWSLVFTGIGLIAMLWAAAIRPLNEDVSRQQKNAETIALAVLKQNEKSEVVDKEILKLRSEFDLQVLELKKVIENGSPTADKRISVLEYQLTELLKAKK